jgi:hypothetical protein
LSLLSDYIRKVGGDVSNTELPPATEPGTHGDPLNGLLSAGWMEVGQDSEHANYKHTDFPGQLITLNYASGSWDHTYYGDSVASGSGNEDLRDHLAEWHGEQKQLAQAKAARYVRATEVVQKWVALTTEQQEAFKKNYQPPSVEIALALKVGTFRFTKKSPPGWSGTVQAMQDHPEISNPWALANFMADQGDTPHYPPTQVSKFCAQTKCE